jgi:hypothetical protein
MTFSESTLYSVERQDGLKEKNGKDFEGSGTGLNLGVIPEFDWGD